MVTMNIALIDDMPQELSRLSEIIREYAQEQHISVEIQTFHSAEDFLADYHPLSYTMIFMDIYMEGMTGVEAVKQIREVDKDALIVFLTTSRDHTFDAFKVHAFQYILKVPENDILKNEVRQALSDAISLHNTFEAGITLSIDGEAKNFPFSGIICAQTEKNYIRITDRQQNSYRTRMTFSAICQLLSKDSRFLQINRGIIINMDYIDTFEKESCVLHGGYTLPVSVRDQKRLDQIRRNYVFSKLQNRTQNGGYLS